MVPDDRSEVLPGVRDTAMKRLRNSSVLDRLKVDRDGAYEMRVFIAAAEVETLYSELQHTVRLFAKASTFPELTALLKLYVRWHSLSDLVAILFNESYDLGMAAEDVSFAVICRNRHVRATSLSAILKAHRKEIRYDEFVKRRNNIVHRGKLGDVELAAIRSDLLLHLSNQTTADDDRQALEAARAATQTEQRVGELLASRTKDYTEHLAATRAFLADIAAVVRSRVEAHPV